MGLIATEYFGRISPTGVSTSTWVCPDGVFFIAAIGIGAGGYGGSAQGAGARGGGGAGGCFVRVEAIPVVPGQSYTIIHPNNPPGDSPGGDAEIFDGATCVLRAKGGAKGANANPGSPSGAAGLGDSSACIGDTIFQGGDGSAGLASTRSGAGGGGAGTNGDGGDASGITPGTGTPTHGGNGGIGSTAGTGGNGGNAQPFGGGGAGARANDGTLRTGGIPGRGLVIITYELPDEIGATAVGFCDAFTGADNPDIEGRTLDGCGGTPAAIWRRDDDYNPVGSNLIILDGSLGANEEESQYLAEAAECPSGEGPRNFQGARATLRFPNYDTITTPEFCTLLWEDDFSGAGTDDPLDGRVHSSGSLGSLTWVRDDAGATGAALAELKIDALGRVYQPAEPSPDAGADHTCVYRLTGAGLAGLSADYDVVIDVERTSFVGATSGVSNGSVGAPVRMQAPGSPSAYQSHWYRYNTSLSDDLHGNWVARAGDSGPIGTLITGSASDPPGDHGIDTDEVRSIRVKVRGTNPAVIDTYIYDDDTGDCLMTGGRVAMRFFDGQFAVRENFNTGPPGLFFHTGGTGEENSYRVRAIRIYEHTPADSGMVVTEGWNYIVLRGLEGSPSHGYQVVLQGTRVSASVFELSTYIFKFGVSGFLLLRDPHLITHIPVQQDTSYVLEGTIENDPTTGNPTIYVRVNGTVVERFDLLADIPDNAAVLLDPSFVFTGGSVGNGVFDANFQFDGNRAVIVERFEVLCPAPDVTPPLGRIWVRRNLLWRELTPEEQLQVRRQLGPRAFLKGWVRANLLNRPFGEAP